MDIEKTITIVRADVKACGESLLRAAEICDTAEELHHLNAVLQAARQTLQGAVFNGDAGKIIDRDIVQRFEEAVTRSTGKRPETRIFS